MRNARSKFETPPATGLVEKYINSAYDTVKLVADNIQYVIEIGETISQGGNLATESWVAEQITNAVDGFIVHQGGYDADTNSPDLTGAVANIEQGWQYIVTNAGDSFFGVMLEAGDVLTANTDAPVSALDWTIVNRNIDSTAFATAAQGALADTAVQPAAIADMALVTTPVSTFPNDAGYTDDQTPAEIKTAYESLVPPATVGEAQVPTETALRSWSPLRISEMIIALQPDNPTPTLEGLVDVDLATTAPTIGQTIVWDGTLWVPGDVGQGGGGATELDALTDVDVGTTPPTDQQALVWDQVQALWVPGDQLTSETSAYLDQRSVSSNYAVTTLDAGAILVVDSSSGAVVITLPDNATQPLAVGTRIDVHHDAGANTVSFVAGGSAAVQGLGGPAFESRGAGYVMSLWKRATNTWQVWGANV
jgi:hypothetical protein